MKFALVATLLLAVASLVSADDTIKPLPPVQFCKDSKLFPANGTQIRNQETCVSLPIGEIPTPGNMVSALIIEPNNGQRIRRNTTFVVKARVSKLATGFFSDPAVDYYQIPQTLNKDGQIQGHSHITIQQIDGSNAPDPQVFSFFKGLNDPANNGVLNVTVTNGLPSAGLYRICTMNAANSHQPVVMPVAQRGAQDDCIRITIVGGRK
ncbi:hypothetical protein RclHR1_05650007 [Rhizophagus clarus]|uniref:Ribosomal protein s17 n=1 Tax=Rhizophagus clarus TaxID=94130 RepID=A0A2Z6SGD4_9GLOM|nr:hypothetical protein RclHR1_05650007 [Rhizophagus clarus]GES87049.1 hypothetical protein GLOIN_2v1713480 [Rhizophagus clarus]